MSVFDDVVVCIPTVGSRAAVLTETLADWRPFGVAPIVQLQPDTWPRSGESQRRNADIALRRALDERPDARHILYCEDDVLLAPELPLWIPALQLLHAPATLFTNGRSHYPHGVQRCLRRGTALPEGIVRVRNLHVWWGSQAILMPRSIAEAVLRWDSDLACWDIHFKVFLQVHALPMYVPVPNPVQQRRVPTSIPSNVIVPHSATFGRQSDGGGISPLPIDWCPYGDWDPDPRMR